MNPRKLLALIAVLGLLFAAVITKNLWTKSAAGRQERQAQAAIPLFAEPPVAASVDKVVVYKGTEADPARIVLAKKEDGEWIVENRSGIRARQDAVERFVAAVRGLEGEVRSESDSVLGDFNITDESAIHIVLSHAGEGVHVLVSPVRPSGFQNFVRLHESPRVIAVPQDILSELGLYAKEDELDYKVFADLVKSE